MTRKREVGGRLPESEEVGERIPESEIEGSAPDIISLSTPWGGRNLLGSVSLVDVDMSPRVRVSTFIQARSKVHLEHIRETGRIRRLALMVSGFCFIVGALIAVFAPASKEKLGYILGGALILLAAGAAGFGWIRAKTLLVEFEAGREK